MFHAKFAKLTIFLRTELGIVRIISRSPLETPYHADRPSDGATTCTRFLPILRWTPASRMLAIPSSVITARDKDCNSGMGGFAAQPRITRSTSRYRWQHQQSQLVALPPFIRNTDDHRSQHIRPSLEALPPFIHNINGHRMQKQQPTLSTQLTFLCSDTTLHLQQRRPPHVALTPNTCSIGSIRRLLPATLSGTLQHRYRPLALAAITKM